MRTLYHMWLSPQCRAVRVILAEKDLECELRAEDAWKRREAFLGLNPSGETPTLRDGERVVCGAYALYDYLDEVYPEPPLIRGDPVERAEVRRLVDWFDRKFDREVTDNLVTEKIMKRFLGRGEPDSSALRAGAANIHYHMDYIGYLTERRNWLAGEWFSLADIVAGAQLSCVDYIGDAPWDAHPAAREWYARIKSRPSFRPLLGDHIAGAPPPKHYANLDF